MKVTFLRGSSLRPLPPVGSKLPGVRSFHVQERADLDQAPLASWIRQASALPGERLF